MLPVDVSARRPLSVCELTSQIKDLLEAAFPEVWVAGEVSNFVRPQSGHCYLTLKDDRVQLKAVMWRGAAARIRFGLNDGLEVICRGRLDVYPPRGSYQLIIEDIVPRGIGALELALRQLREKLARRIVRSGPQAAAAGVGASDRGGDKPDGRGHPRLLAGARATMARG